METTSKKNWPPNLKEYYLNFILPLTSTAMGQLILNRKCYQVSKPEMELHMINMIYAALPMRKVNKQKRQNFHTKTTCVKLYIYIIGEARNLYIDEACTALDIFPFAIFFYLFYLKITRLRMGGVWKVTCTSTATTGKVELRMRVC